MQPTAPAAIGLAVAVAVFAYDGYGSTVYFGEEMHGARKRIGRTILFALVVTVVAELVPLLAVLTGAPDLKALLGAKAIFSAFVAQRGRRAWLGRLMGVGVGLAIINAVIATRPAVRAPALLHRARPRRGAPASAAFSPAAIRPRIRPWVATLTAGVLASGLCFVSLKLLLIVTGTGVAIIYAILCVAVIAGTAQRRDGGRALPHAALSPRARPRPHRVGGSLMVGLDRSGGRVVRACSPRWRRRGSRRYTMVSCCGGAAAGGSLRQSPKPKLAH